VAAAGREKNDRLKEALDPPVCCECVGQVNYTYS
jgi:hypothetical protein